jgi:CcmD family protein
VKISHISKRARIGTGTGIGIGIGIAILALPGTALAAASAQDSPPGESNLGFLLVGELIVWAGFFAYTFYTSRKTNEMRREIDDLRAQLNKPSVS